MSGEDDDYHYTGPDGSRVPKHVDAKGNPIPNVPMRPTKVFDGEITTNFDAPVYIAPHDELEKLEALVQARALRGINSPTPETEQEYWQKLQNQPVGSPDEHNGIAEEKLRLRRLQADKKREEKNRKRRKKREEPQ